MESFYDATGVETRVSPSSPLPVTGLGGGLPPDVLVSGTLAALNATLAITPGPRDTLVVAVSGTFVGTLSLQGSLDGITWFTVNGPATWLNVSTGAATTAITTTGLWQCTISALPYVRLAETAYTSGSSTVVLDATDGNAMVALDAPLPAGGNVVGIVTLGVSGTGNVGMKTSNASAAPSDNSLVVTQSPNYVGASGGYKLSSAATTNASSAKGSAGNLMQATILNTSAATVYVKLYDKASAPVVGTDLPVDVIPVLAGGRFAEEYGQYGKRFPTGIALAITAAAADADTTAVATGVRLHLTTL